MSNPKVPYVVKEASKAVERDIKPALKLMGKLFFNTWLGDASFVREVIPTAPALPKEVSRPRPKPRTAGHTKVVARAASAPPSSTSPIVIDAEFVDDCPVCGGTGKVGRIGHEIECPSCKC